MSRHSSLLKNTGILALGKFSTQFIGLLLLPIYTQFLSPAEYGIFDLVMTYVILALPFLTLRTEFAIFRFLIDARGDKLEITKVISTGLRLLIASIAFLVGIAAGVSLLVDIKYSTLVIVLAVAMAISGIFLQVSRGIGSNTGFAIASVVAGLVSSLGSIVTIVWLGWGVEGIFVSAILGNVLAILFLFFNLKLYKYISFVIYSSSLAKELLKFGVPMIPSGLAWWVINGLDRTLILIFLGLTANGIYAIASKYAFVLVSMSTVFGMAWKESASMHINAKDRDEYFSQTINTSLKVFGALGLLLISVTPVLFDTVFGQNYRDAMLYIPLLVLGAFFNMLVEMYAGIYVAKKMSGKLAITNIIAAIISITLNLVLIQLMGLYAVAISMVVAFGSMALWRSQDVKKYVTIKYDKAGVAKLTLAASLVVVLYYFAGINGSILATLLVLVLIVHFAQPAISILKQKYLKHKANKS